MPAKKNDEKQLLGARIRQLRKKLHLTQEELAEQSGIHYKFLGGIERGSQNPTLEVLSKVAKALHVNVADLFEYGPFGLDPGQVRRLLIEGIKRTSDEEILQLYRVYLSLQ